MQFLKPNSIMTKKLMIMLFMSIAFGNVCIGQKNTPPGPIDLNVYYDDPYGQKGQTRAPARIPLFYIEKNTLSFNPYDDDFVVELRDGDTLVYSQTVFAGTNQVELPTSLEGEYSLLIKFENKAYVGNVEL